MILALVLAAVALLGLTGVVALLLGRDERGALAAATAGTITAAAVGLAGALAALLSGARVELRGPALPVGTLHLAVDPLSALFLASVFLVGGLGALYGAGYLRAYLGKRRLAPALALYAWLLASMAGVVLARDVVPFLFAWEAMSVASFFLVTFESEREEVRRAGYVYLVASQLGAVLVFVAFGLLARSAGSFDFDAFARAAPPRAGLVFVLALAGFGAKAGFWPMHVWLPEAHPAAPSHVSAVMSGVMIKLGVYGLLRVLELLGEPAPWWAVTLIVVGGVSALAGILLSLAQTDLKRLLAYSSVENVGIIGLGLGLGLLGRSQGMPGIAVAGFAGALVHVVNHGLMKGVLFQAAGSVLHATGTRELDALGGLGRRMPLTALLFLAGGLAISGLPPLNGFVGEWLVYVGALRGGMELRPAWSVAALLVVPALALVGGLAAAAFVRAYGLVFLGEPRSGAGEHAHEAPWAMRAAMLIGVALCVAIGLWPAGAVRLVLGPAAALAGVASAGDLLLAPLAAVTRVASVLLLAVGLLYVLRRLLLRGREVRAAPTWGCGYASPSSRMQYTSGSFAQPVIEPFAAAIPAERVQAGPTGYFPAGGRLVERHVDVAREWLVWPLFRHAAALLSRARVIQQGRTQLYLAYVLVTLIVLLVWQLARARGF